MLLGKVELGERLGTRQRDRQVHREKCMKTDWCQIERNMEIEGCADWHLDRLADRQMDI